MGDRSTPTELGASFELRIGLNCWPSSCGSSSRAVRRHPTRRTATRRGSLHSPLAANCYRLRANSTIPRGIVVLGRAPRRPRTNGPCFCGSKNRRACALGRSAHPRSAQPEPDRIGAANGCFAPATRRVARAGRLPTGGPQHAAPRRKLRYLPGVRLPKSN